MICRIRQFSLEPREPKHWYQQYHGQETFYKWHEEPSGDAIMAKEEDTTRLIFPNVGGIPCSNLHPKNQE